MMFADIPRRDSTLPPSMIEAHELSRRFGHVVAVDRVSFAVPKGAVAGFLGPNGAGKTTAIRMLVGFIPPTAGRAVVANLDVHRQWREARRRIGYLPEATPLYLEMRVVEFLRFRARLLGLRRHDAHAAIEESLDQCDLASVRRRVIGELSKGYRQRVGLAAALLHRPDVLILDEPTSGLDPTQVQHFRSLIRGLAGRQTVLVSSHVLAEVEATCDRVLIINRGKMVADGTLDDLRLMQAPRIVLETERDPNSAIATLAGVADVETRRLEDGWHRTTVEANARRDLREPIARACAAAGVAVRELRREEETLERLFLRLASDEEPGLPETIAARSQP